MFHSFRYPGRLRILAVAISAALITVIPHSTLAADGSAGAPATPNSSAQGGGGGGMDNVTGLGGNGGAGGLGAGGQASSNGDDGAAGSVNNVTNTLPSGTATGGAGQGTVNNATNGSGAAGGGGGGGSAGAVLNNNTQTNNPGSIIGGNGGHGGNGGSNTTDIADAGNGGNGGNGGDGGSGVLITSAGTYGNSGTITGGDGGNGGNTGGATANASTTPGITIHGGSGGAGGVGGDGVTATQGGNLNNTGTVTGGRGATGGLAANANTVDNVNVIGIGGTGGLAADGGNGVSLSDDSSVTNSGSISGGAGGDGGNGGAVDAGQGTGVVGSGAAGADGGSGIVVIGSGTVTNLANGQIVGGNAGTGGGGNSNSSGLHLTGGDGGNGGDGGSGIILRGGGSVSNFGSVTGGAGNRGGGSGSLASSHGGDSGVGGTGIEIDNQGSVINEATGVVTGGKGGDDSAGGGGSGGVGGNAVGIIGAGTVTNRGQFIGGDGGEGANGNSATTNGGAGAQGGNGLMINGQGTVINEDGASITGGLGGTGGGSGGADSQGGNGGKGGSGVLISAGGAITNNGTIVGGSGNRGGGGGAGDGGAGGSGVSITTGGGSVNNTGTISGGNGSEAGTAGNTLGAGNAGVGGVGIYGSDMSVINSGTIEGGMAFDSTTRSQAIVFSGGTNSLELRAGYNVLGIVEAGNGDNTLILGGSTDSQFDASTLGDAAQYQGFDHFNKTGSSTWALNNSTDAVTPWTLYEGVLQIAQDSSLGASTGTLTFDGGTLQLTNSFDLASDRPVVLGDAGGTLDTQQYNTTLTQGITGSGGLTKIGNGALTMAGDSTYAGTTLLEQGHLDVTGSISGDVTASSGTLLSGTGSVGATTLEAGSTLTVGSPLEQDRQPASFTVNGALNNQGTINMSRRALIAGNHLQVKGNYIGAADSHLNINTVLGDDNSLTDKMTVQGDTSGTTLVQVNNVGGQGAKTDQGIEVVDVTGNSAAGAFVKYGRIVAGANEYNLVQKGQNWYLTSLNDKSTQPIDPLPPVVGGVDPTDPLLPIQPVEPTTPGDPLYRPEAGGYLINLSEANTLFNLTLDDREGATEYSSPLDARSTTASTFWLRQEGGQNRFRAGDGQIRSTANRYVAQMGNEFLHGTTNNTDRWGAGLMAGYGNVSGDSHSTLTGYRTQSQMDGYSVGTYGTWYQDAVTRKGLYLDSWVMYNWFNNQVEGEDLPTENYKSRGFTASLESGYNILLSDSERQSVYLEPQAQLTWMNVKSPDHTEANGTVIQDNGPGNLQSRLGMRLYLRGHRLEDDGKGREFKPYVEANWLHNTRDFGVQMGDTLMTQEGARNIAQVKLGVQGQISPALNVWGGTAAQVGDNGYHDTSVMLGVKYGF